MAVDLELCTESIEALPLAEKFAFNRIELCAAIEIGGLTPSKSMIEHFSTSDKVETHVMIRPRGGGFVYSPEEISIMVNDIKRAADAGCSGVVFGCLTTSGEIDLIATEKLAKTANLLNLDYTFHRAFDFCGDPISSLEKLIELSFTRILTSGQKEKAIEGLKLISQLKKKASNRIQIMAGSGINKENAHLLIYEGVDALHFTAHKKIESPGLGMGKKYIMDETKIAQLSNTLLKYSK